MYLWRKNPGALAVKIGNGGGDLIQKAWEQWNSDLERIVRIQIQRFC